MAFKNGVKSIQTAGYNGAHMVTCEQLGIKYVVLLTIVKMHAGLGYLNQCNPGQVNSNNEIFLQGS